MSKIYKALKPDGVFIFDALNKLSLKNMSFSKSWEYSEGGFWRPAPYICLSENIHYENEKATLEQHIVFEENGNYEIYCFWNHYFNVEDIEEMFIPAGFCKIDLLNIELSGGLYNNEGVSFYKITK